MWPINYNFTFTFLLLCLAFVFPFSNTFPVSTKDDPFDKFIEFLSRNNCSMPKQVELPFAVSNPASFSYLSAPLKECQSPEALKENNKANLLCKEVFDVFQNITCIEYNLPLPKINSSHLSADVCKDFAEIQDIIPKQDEYLSRKLGDSIICKVLCTEKYELLCKTLLWSYDTQAKIKKALDSRGKGKDHQDGKAIMVQAETSPEDHQEINEIPDKPTPKYKNTEISLNGSNLNNAGSSLNTADLETALPKSTSQDQTVTTKNISNLNSDKDGKHIKSNNISQEVPSSVPIQPDTQKDLLDENIEHDEQSPELLDKNIDQEQNGLENQSQNMKTGNSISDINSKPKVHAVTSEINGNQNGEPNSSADDLPAIGNTEDNANTNINIKPKEKNPNPIIPKIEIDNDLNSVDFEEPTENETKIKEKQADLSKKKENTKSFISDVATSETDSKLLESTILPIYPDKNEDLEQRPEVKDPEQYNDSENDGDYAKQEYDTGFNPALKKNSDTKNSVEDGSSQISSISNIQINPENFPVQGLDVSRNYLPARNYLPEQEDSHFFFYFLSIVLILMAGYLIFHNKQKIIALIVEGRHERRRRSHGTGYKKLETK